MPTRILPAPDFRLALVEEPWPFAEENRDAIDRHWLVESRRNPHLFNGKVLLAIRSGFDADGVFFGDHVAVEFKAFLAWRDWGFDAGRGRNIFGSTLIRPADGGFLMGCMGGHTANAGKVYPPSGTLDLTDVGDDGTIDIEASMRRELREETGLLASQFTPGPAYIVIEEKARVCVARVMHSTQPAQALMAEIHRLIAADPEPELSHMVHVRQAMALPDEVYLPYVQAIIRELA
jgi:8-oxo-dGTP pyrophosphatase MutT (NUDIX family)